MMNDATITVSQGVVCPALFVNSFFKKYFHKSNKGYIVHGNKCSGGGMIFFAFPSGLDPGNGIHPILRAQA